MVIAVSAAVVLQGKVRLPHALISALPFEWNTGLHSQQNVTSGDVNQTSDGVTQTSPGETGQDVSAATSESKQKVTQTPDTKKSVTQIPDTGVQVPETKTSSRQTMDSKKNLSKTQETKNSVTKTTDANNDVTQSGQQSAIPTTEVVVQKSRKTILYICDSFGCGGFADRQKGIVSAYVLAAMLKREFKVHMTVPCNLANFMAPNGTGWRITTEELKRANVHRIRHIDHRGVTYAKELLKKDNLDEEFPHNYTAFTWNMELVQYFREHRLAKQVPWLRDLSVPDVYRFVLDKLFSLKPELQRDLKTLRDSLPKDSKLVCAQVRLGSHGNFKDVKTYYTLEQFPTISDFLKKYNETDRYRFLVTSDSEELVSLTETSFPNRTLKIPGPITHVDKARGANACDGFKKAILDEYALATCDVLVISESGLGKIAAFRRGTDDDLYIFLGSNIEPFKRGSPFPKYKKSWRR
ncbi:hypothetical protein BaRGS_00019314 [Batillaria attramentaria]|uniref:Uncharacterized protein n=1 Tax=Batillaria attramentaria TaxID=370345 RepID=A0ABD0KRK0_9CAEN